MYDRQSVMIRLSEERRPQASRSNDHRNLKVRYDGAIYANTKLYDLSVSVQFMVGN